ncbi:MAG TPA: DNA internalization-related competence protein ComEC/Rec2 [Gammaproteobacteria bacterium]|nr:DNA internalization-related competence protein ComEC/Rec2 [Gammaproteobacteria bacterium]
MCTTLFIPQLPPQSVVYACVIGALVILSLRTKHALHLLAVAILGFSYITWHANQHIQHALPRQLETQKITVIGTISSVDQENKKPKIKFRLNVSKVYNNYSGWQLPATIQLSWNGAKQVAPGDVWKLQVKLKRPRNYANPGSFDTEKYFFQQRVAALGYVVASPMNHLLQQNPGTYPINTLRQWLHGFVQQSIGERTFAPVITALALGSKADLSEEQTAVLQNTGTAHLLAISGLHIGMIASMVFAVLRLSWRFVPAAFLRIPAPWFAACGALVLSIVYALLAGFSIATQRSIIMLSVLLFGILLKRKVSTVHSFCLALFLVLVWDPFAILSIGFWFSFLAVGFLMYALRGRFVSNHHSSESSCHPGKSAAFTRDLLHKAVRFLKPQIVITVGLLPITLLFFAKNSLIGPVANILAIPWVSFAVLPCTLIAMLLIPIQPAVSSMLFKAAEHNFALLWTILEKLAHIRVYTWHVPDNYLSLIIIAALLGTIWLFVPRGLPGRWWGVFGFLPLFFVQSAAIPYGQADFTLLDVGQGLATVVRTQNHVLVYDTGAKLQDNFDLGTRVVVPYLHNVGIKKIDALMISHGDNDHVGGAPGLLRSINANVVITSDDQTLSEFNPGLCIAGQQWEWDGVQFTVLHPDAEEVYKKRNDRSCVLMVQAGDHKALLTGDIEKRSEKQLVARYGNELQADLMLVPHHGSKTSSSAEFLQTVNPKYALIPVGYKNQYGHPKEPVLQRYRDMNIAVLRTEYDGAINFRLGAELLPECYRRAQKGFWHY